MRTPFWGLVVAATLVVTLALVYVAIAAGPTMVTSLAAAFAAVTGLVAVLLRGSDQ